jgi:hypothetical protein
VHGNGIKVELEIPLSLDTVDCTGNAQVLGIPVEWAFDADLRSGSLREEMAKLLGVECAVTEVWVFVSCWSGEELGYCNLHFWIISSVVWNWARGITLW